MNVKIVFLSISILFKSQTRQKTIEKKRSKLYFDLRNRLHPVVVELMR